MGSPGPCAQDGANAGTPRTGAARSNPAAVTDREAQGKLARRSLWVGGRWPKDTNGTHVPTGPPTHLPGPPTEMIPSTKMGCMSAHPLTVLCLSLLCSLVYVLLQRHLPFWKVLPRVLQWAVLF